MTRNANQPRSTRRATSRRATSLGAVCALTVAGAVLPASSASAEETPTSRELLDLCDNGTDVCVFHPDGAEEEQVEQRDLVVDNAINCSGVNQQTMAGWTDTKGESNSLSIEVKAEMKWGPVYTSSVTASYGHDWNWSHSQGGQSLVTIAPGKAASLTRSTRVVTVDGQFELHFGDKYKGHYYWYVPFTSTTTVSADNPTFTDRDMTDEERARCPQV